MTRRSLVNLFSLSFFLFLFTSITIGCSNNGSSSSAVQSLTIKTVSPANDAKGVPLPVDFIWISDYSGSVSGVYSIYLGKDRDNLKKIADNLNSIEYSYNGATNSTRYFWKVELSVRGKIIASSKVVSFTTNYPPEPFSLLKPENDSIVNWKFVTLKWKEPIDKEGDNIKYKIFLGDSPDSLSEVGESYLPQFILSGLVPGKAYYWKIRAIDSSNGTTDSPVWKFHTAAIPLKPLLYSPINNENDVSVRSKLVWNKVNSFPSDPIVYDVYLGIANALVEVAKGITSTTYKFHNLVRNTTYFWKVVARDSFGNSKESDVWSFTTSSNLRSSNIIVSADSTTLYIDSEGNLWAFGRNVEGELADGTTNNHNKPVLINNPDHEKWRTIGAGILHACAIDESGTLFCWGWDYYGQLGIGYKTPKAQTRLHKVENPFGNGWVSVDGGSGHTCAVDTEGKLYCWGYNINYQLGQPDSSIYSYYPRIVSGSQDKFWTEVNVGYFFSCAKDNKNRLWCWGDNTHGQLPTSDSHSYFPLEISNSDHSLWSSFSVGYDHACAIDVNGSLWCWGRNNYGQIGNGTGGKGDENYNVSATSPAKIYVPGNKSLGWKSVSTNAYHTCAVDKDGSMWCWGKGNWGDLGNGSLQNSNVPVKVDSREVSGWDTPASGRDYSCGIDNNGAVLCWGFNNYGQLGIGIDGVDNVNIPNIIKNRFDSPWKKIVVGGYNSFGFDANNNLYGWGGNFYGSLGRYGRLSYFHYDFPITVFTDRKIVEVFTNLLHSCVKDTDNNVWCVGYNKYGQLGNGASDYSIYPVLVTNSLGTQWKELSLGYIYTCGLDIDGDLWCWGDNRYGQLGNYSTESKKYPVLITNSSGTKWVSISLNYYHSCGIDVDKNLWCWGHNNVGQLGDHSNINKDYPVLITNSSGTKWVSISLGFYHSCGIDVDKNLWCWGHNNVGQLGDYSNIDKNYPVLITNSSGTKWVSISLGYYHTCGIDVKNDLWCWGSNKYGQLGKGNYDDSNHPVLISNNLRTKWVSVSLGVNHTCSLDVNGILWCWGRDDYGALGLGGNIRVYPARVFGY